MGATKAPQIRLTDRALRDIAEIRAYSVSQWGKRVAARYIADLEAALTRVQKEPDLLRAEQSLHPDLRFYRVNRHVLVCDVQPRVIFVLTVVHASRDIPSRLSELEPILGQEVQLLRDRLRRAERAKK